MTVYDYMSRVIRECKEYVENFKNEKGSILFTGNTGCGKTFLSNCIARELIRRYFSVVYLTATDMFDILAGSRFNGGDDDEAKDQASYILDCDLLIIDDLGTELINTFTASQMFYCVNEHCAHLVHVYAISHANGHFHHFVRVVFGDVLKVLAKERTVEKRYYAAVGGDNLCALVGDAVHLAAYAVTFYKVAHAHTSGHE